MDCLVTTNDRKMILGIDSKFGLSILRSKLQDFRNELISIYFKIKIFLCDCFKPISTQIRSNVGKCDTRDLFSRS